MASGVKIWPEIVGYVPALTPLIVNKSKGDRVTFDFSQVEDVNCSGLNLLINNILKLSKSLNEVDYDYLPPNKNSINRFFIDSGFYSILDHYFSFNTIFNVLTKDLWHKTKKITTKSNECKITHFPIYHLKFKDSKQDKRDVVDEFVDWLFDEISFLYELYKYPVNNFISLLKELAKNSADHTDGDAFFGIDIYLGSESIQIKWSFGDLGDGIFNNVKNNIKIDENYTEKEKHLSLSDAYHYALKIGNTTKSDKPTNKGIGMSIITGISKELNIDLSVFDANSRGLLNRSKDISHSELRRTFFGTGKSVGFYYYGSTKYQNQYAEN